MTATLQREVAELAGSGAVDCRADLVRIRRAAKALAKAVEGLFDDAPLGPKETFNFATVRHEIGNELNVVIQGCDSCRELAEEQSTLQAILPGLARARMAALVLKALKDDLRYSPQPVAHASLPTASLSELRGTILVADDRAENRDQVREFLCKRGHTVVEAQDGLVTLQRLREADFDLVLLDVNMPGKSGVEVLAQMRADAKLRHVPVIMISALDDQDVVLGCIEMGAEDFLTKPFDRPSLDARTKACLERKRLRDLEVKQSEEIKRQKQRVEQLLHAIFPAEAVDELKNSGDVKPRPFSGVAVMFADIVGFTRYCDQRPPEEVVEHLQKVVEAWELSATMHGIEKIKTIGDAFMAASGLWRRGGNPVLNCARCGLEMIQATRHLAGWELRVGIHIGSVVAGKIGHSKYLFDLWGDTVNTASRIESHGIPGSIAFSPVAWQHIASVAEGEAVTVDLEGLGRSSLIRLIRLLGS